MAAPEFPNRLDAADIWRGDGDFLPDAEPTPLSAIGDDAEGEAFCVVGRINNIRSNFILIQDVQGVGELQLYVTRKGGGALDAEALSLIDAWSVCDIVAARGEISRSKRGDLYLAIRAAATLTPTANTLPPGYYGLKDEEKRRRERHLDLIVNPEARAALRRRAEIIAALRRHFDERGFLEVETPLLQARASGAAAKPFRTHHNSMDLDLHLRVAPELYLKRLVIGGMGGVYEIGRCFRNEGLSPRHNPEFTMLECYKPLRDHRWMIDCIWACLRGLAEQFGGGALHCGGRAYALAAEAPRRGMLSLLLENAAALRETLDEAGWTALLDDEVAEREVDAPPRAALAAQIEAQGIDADADFSIGWALAALYEKIVEPTLMEPLFVTDFPTAVSPLARADDAHPGLCERFELVAAGMEIANGFSELNDPEEQARRFAEQRGGEAMLADSDYVEALRYGLPPTAGCGVGVDRLVMLLCDLPSIRDALAFPLVRPDGGDD